MDDWDKSKQVCGNCKHWALQGYQHDWDGAEPLGASGYGLDGSAGECLRHAPIAVGANSPGKTAVWPKTEKRDTCGDFERRPTTVSTGACHRVLPGQIVWAD